MADLTGHDLQLRAITTGFMNSFDFAFVTWWPLVFYPVTDAPNYRKGYIASLIVGCLTIPVILVIAILERRGRQTGVIGRDAAPPSESDQFSEPINSEDDAIPKAFPDGQAGIIPSVAAVSAQ